MIVEQNAPLQPYNTFGIVAKARTLVRVQGEADVQAVLWLGSAAMLIGSVPGEEEQVARAVVRHPDRFVGAFMLDPTQEGALTRVAWALAQPGMRVVCLFPAMHGYSPSDRRVLGLAEQVAGGSGTALFVHCGVLSVGIRKKLGLPSAFEARYGNPLELQGLALRHPSLPIIVPHFEQTRCSCQGYP